VCCIFLMSVLSQSITLVPISTGTAWCLILPPPSRAESSCSSTGLISILFLAGPLSVGCIGAGLSLDFIFAPFWFWYRRSCAPGFNPLPPGFPFPACEPKASASFPTQRRFCARGGDFEFPLVVLVHVGSRTRSNHPPWCMCAAQSDLLDSRVKFSDFIFT
jgi:hypothetical protein